MVARIQTDFERVREMALVALSWDWAGMDRDEEDFLESRNGVPA